MGLFDLDELKKLTIWAKALKIPGRETEAAEWRMDVFYNVIRYSHYGNRSSEYGWEYDHVTPTALGGIDAYANLRPLHHREGRAVPKHAGTSGYQAPPVDNYPTLSIHTSGW